MVVALKLPGIIIEIIYFFTMLEKSGFPTRLLRGDLSVIFYMSLCRLLLHILVNLCCAYGYFRDELYYLACSDHLAFGYVDQPALSIFILKLNTLVVGKSLVAIRLIPAIAGAATVFTTGLITREMGGQKFAQFLACLCSFSLITLAMNGYYSMNSIDIMLWAATAYLLLKIIKTERPAWWIILGIVLGLGLANKINVLFLGVGLFAGLILTDQRKWLVTKWPYFAGAIAFVLFAPYVIWNAMNHWPHLEFIHNASSKKYAGLTPMRFIIEQFLINNPLASTVWIAGLISLFWMDILKKYRMLAFLFIGPLLIFLVNGTSKAEYLAPAYCVLWSSGAIAWEHLTAGKRNEKIWCIGISTIIIIPLLILMPMVLPVLPVQNFIAYSKTLGIAPDSSEGKELSELPQFYADMFGWQEKTDAVRQAYQTLTPEEKRDCVIYSDNYGRCGAIDLFGKPLGLPHAIGSHNNYWIWGPGNASGRIVIVLGSSKEQLQQNFQSIEEVVVSTCEYCMPYENNVPVFICRNIRTPLPEIWPRIKAFI